MRKLVILAALSLTAALFAQEAQEEEVLEQDAVSEVEVAQEEEAQEQEEIEAQEEEAPAPAPAPKPAPAPVVAAVKEEPAPAPVAEKKEEKKGEYPKFKQSGAIFLTPRMEITSRRDFEGYEVKDTDSKEMGGGFNANRRRLMLGWSYKLGVAVNEKLDVNFRLSDPSAEAAHEVYGSGDARHTSGRLNELVRVTLPNAYFTWKAADIFHLSGGLLNVPSSAALDLQAAYLTKDPTRNFQNEYGNSLAGFDFAFPIASAVKVFATAGIADNYRGNLAPIIEGKDTTKSYNDFRILVGADLSLAEKKVTLKPIVNIMTVTDNNTESRDSSTSTLVSGSVDANIKLASQFSLNAFLVALSHNKEKITEDKEKLSMLGLGVEPVYTFGGENNKLFTARVKYAFDFLDNYAKNSGNNGELGVVQFIEARFGIAVNEKMSITPRVRYWIGNGAGDAGTGGWYARAFGGYDEKNESARAFGRYEIAFSASF